MSKASANKVVSIQTGSAGPTEKGVDVNLPRLRIMRFDVQVRAVTTLITHNWDSKITQQMADKQQGKAKMKKAAKDPEADFEGAKYKDEQKRDCVPLLAFKNAIVSAARFADDLKMTVLRGALFLEHPEGPAKMLLPIEYSKCVMREDHVRVGQGTADLRYRPEYFEWGAKFTVAINQAMLTPEQVLNLVNLAGFGVGICEWRPEKNGPHGRFVAEL